MIPALMRCEDEDGGTVLGLSTGQRFVVDVSRGTIERAFRSRGYDLEAGCLDGSIDVWLPERRMTALEWARIVSILRDSPAFRSQAQADPWLLRLIDADHGTVASMPMRICGGIRERPARAGLYLSHPCDFAPDPTRPGTRTALLSGPRGRLARLSVCLDRGTVEIEAGVVPGHFLEEASSHP